jgi:hypothetical protein
MEQGPKCRIAGTKNVILEKFRGTRRREFLELTNYFSIGNSVE